MIEIKEVGNVDDKFVENMLNTPFHQSNFYGKWRKNSGYNIKIIEAVENGEKVFSGLFISCHLMFGKRFFVSHIGPVVKKDFFTTENIKIFKKEIKKILNWDNNTVFIRMDFGKFDNKTVDIFFQKAPKKTYQGSCFQPRSDWIIDLSQEDEVNSEGRDGDLGQENILKNMHKKSRYDLKLAQKNNLKVDIVENNFLNYFDEFIKVQKETAKRNKNFVDEKYFKNIFDSLESGETKGFLVIVFNKSGSNIITINLIILYGDTAYFAFGASSEKDRNLGSNYIANWEALKKAKLENYKFYNFGGYYDENNLEVNKKFLKKSHGYSRFKKRFGGQKLQYNDFVDIIWNKFWYWIFVLYKYYKFYK